MVEDIEKKEEKKKEVKAKTSKTTTKKNTNKKESSKKVDATSKKGTKKTTKKDEDNQHETNSRLDELTKMIEKVEEEKKKTRTRKKEEPKEEPKEEKQDEKERENKEDTIKVKKSRTKSTSKKEENITKSKELTIKENKEELIINSEKLEKIEKEIKKRTTITEEQKNKMNKTIFQNIAIANIITLYFMFLILGYKNVLPEKFMIDLQVFSVITIGITIIIFEKAYKKDSSKYALHGIEILFLAIVTLLSTYVYTRYQEKFIYIMLTVCYIFDIYYVIKSIAIYLKMRTKALKRVNDIHKIVKS